MSDQTLTVASWNVQGESKTSSEDIREQVEFLFSALDEVPDIINFQAVACRNKGNDPWYRGVDVLRSRLAEHGLGHLVHSCDWAAELANSTIQPHHKIKASHERANVTASRFPLSRKRLEIDGEISARSKHRQFTTNFPERILVSEVQSKQQLGTRIENWNVGVIAGSSWGEEKIKILETVYSHLSGNSNQPRLLAGDFNTPNDERNDEDTGSNYITYGGRQEADEENKGDLRKPSWIAERWHDAELKVLEGCDDQLHDAFRQKHGHQLKDSNGHYQDGMYSHKAGGTKKRLDHIFSDAQRFTVESCRYLSLQDAPSDHAPIVATLSLQ